jgi:lipoprotein NlpD
MIRYCSQGHGPCRRARIEALFAARLLMTGFLFCLITACAPPRGIYHTVQPGQTLYRIGRAYRVDADYLARINQIGDPSQLRSGQRLFVPGARKVRYVPATVKIAQSTEKRKKTGGKRRSSGVSSAPAVTHASRTTAHAKKQAVSDDTSRLKRVKGTFGWPARGKLVKPFGQQGAGGRKGIEIGVSRGAYVVAAAAGMVTYSGNGIKGFGNLIILKHGSDYFTVYGFNQKNLVGTGAFVSKGERIAMAGVPPGYKRPRLHFEIRRGKQACNPILFLP